MSKFQLAFTLAAVLLAAHAQAAFVSSSSSGGASYGGLSSHTNQQVVPTSGAAISLRNLNYSAAVLPHVNFIAVSADPATDTGRVDDIHFGTTTIPANSFGGSFPVDVTYQVTPANFPDPPVNKHIVGTYSELFSINSLTLAAPTFGSSTTVPIVFKTFGFPHFVMQPTLAINAPTSFTVTGTYTASGPVNSTTVPFSVTYQRTSQPASMTIHVAGNPGFGPGFNFTPFGPGVTYSPTNPQVFTGTVDDVRFSAELGSVNIRYFIPEPSALGLAVTGAVLCWRRKTR